MTSLTIPGTDDATLGRLNSVQGRGNNTTAIMSSAQVKAHLLCAECEERFNQGGEDWVLKDCWRSPTALPLHSALMPVPTLVDDRGFRSWEGFKVPGVHVRKLAYFGFSIFWRASVHDWRVGKENDQRIPLGRYQNALRLYLLGKTAVPDGIVLLVTLSSALDDLLNRVLAMPWRFNRTAECRTYKFVVTGLNFLLFVGMQIPEPTRRICSARRGFLFMSEERDADLLKTMAIMAIMAKWAEGKGKLAE
jgi:hypothetical protein